mmetsp:Transcript_48030/g.155801  ORF Transcript_48030/g.155801 Transcript_48030/m.155801 type:complete len:108 (+) Transcript_48030:222-545(+)
MWSQPCDEPPVGQALRVLTQLESQRWTRRRRFAPLSQSRFDLPLGDATACDAAPTHAVIVVGRYKAVERVAHCRDMQYGLAVDSQSCGAGPLSTRPAGSMEPRLRQV